MSKIYIGIDIGITKGAIAIMRGNLITGHEMTVFKGNLDISGLNKIITNYVSESVDVHVIFERLGVIYGSSKKTAFSMGYQMGCIEALCVANNIPYTAVQATKWQKQMFADIQVINKTGKSSKDTKAMALVAVTKLFPTLKLTFGRQVKPHDGFVDAVLIAEYARRNNL